MPWGLARLLRVKDAVVDGGGLNNPKVMCGVSATKMGKEPRRIRVCEHWKLMKLVF